MAHKLVTDEMVEKATQSLYHDPQNVTADEKESIRAALEAVADDLIEACAKVADKHGRDWRLTRPEWSAAAEIVAGGIRRKYDQ
jgi:hypothetical protein